MKKNEITEQDYRDAAKNSFSIAGMCRELGLGSFGANYRKMHKAIDEYKIDISHFTGKGWNIGLIFKPYKKYELEEILVENSTYDNTNTLRNRLLSEGVKKHICERCGRTEWEGELIPLQLHHINGIRNDNRIENLQLLCPNCHALTDNYCGKNAEKNSSHKLSLEEKYNKLKDAYGIDVANEILKKYKAKKIRIKKEKKRCPICGKEVKNSRFTFCSYDCAHKAQRKLPSDDIMNEHILNGLNNSQIAELYNVSEASIRKWKKTHSL